MLEMRLDGGAVECISETEDEAVYERGGLLQSKVKRRNRLLISDNSVNSLLVLKFYNDVE